MSDEYERLVVLIEARLDQFEKQMVRAEKRGTATYQKLQTSADKATSAMQARINQFAQSQGRALDQVAGKTEAAAERSAKGYAAWWREMERGRDAINQLRSSVDPAFAATLRYEQAVAQTNDALRRNIITETEHRQILDQVSVAYLKGGQAAGAHTGVLGALGNMSDATKGKLQNAGYQVQDVAVQMMAGTDAARALSMQLPQMLGGFGLLGVVLGTLAAVGLPLLSSMLGAGEGAAKSFDDAIGAVNNSLSAMNEQAAIYTAEGLTALKEKYGELNFELLRFVDLQTEAMQRQALEDTAASMSAIMDEMAGWEGIVGNLSEMFEGAAGQVNHLVWAMDDVKSARTFEDQLAAVTRLRLKIEELTGGIGNMTDEQFAFYQEVMQSEDALKQLVVAQPKQGWLAGAIGAAETLAGKLWEAVRANSALAASSNVTTGNADWTKNDFGFTLPGDELLALPEDQKTGGGGGSGGGGSNKIDALIEDLKTEQELLSEWYDESLLMLNSSTDAELAVVGGKHEALERLEAEHQARLKAIRDEAQGRTLADAGNFFGAMANLASVGGKKTAKAVAVFQAIEGTINAYGAAIKALNTPGLTIWGRYAAYASVLAAGLKGVAAIRAAGGVGGGGGGGGGAASSGGAAASGATDDGKGPLRVSMERLDPTALYSGAAVGKLLDLIMEEAGDRGVAFTKGAGA